MVEKNDIIIILDMHWNGCVAVVDEVKPWGVQCYVKIPLKGNAYYRVKTDDFEIVGKIPDSITEMSVNDMIRRM